MTKAEMIKRAGMFAPLIDRVATRYQFDPALIAAIIEQESDWDQYAIRVERGFFTRYFFALVALVKRTVSKSDDRWIKYPDVFSCSYGLMQTMYPVALEHGFEMNYPTRLCEPSFNMEVGCTILKSKYEKADGNLQKALLYYNGGKNKKYPSEVIGRVAKYFEVFDGLANTPGLAP